MFYHFYQSLTTINREVVRESLTLYRTKSTNLILNARRCISCVNTEVIKMHRITVSSCQSGHCARVKSISPTNTNRRIIRDVISIRGREKEKSKKKKQKGKKRNERKITCSVREVSPFELTPLIPHRQSTAHED